MDLSNVQSETAERIMNEVFSKINEKELNLEQASLLYRLWDYLAKFDLPSKADLAFVFGGPGDQRAYDAIKLFKDEMVTKILFTGSYASYLKNENTLEAEYFAEIAKQNQIPDTALILETESRNTPENAVFSVKKMKEMNFFPKRIIIITLPYHMRRSYLTLKSVIDWDLQLICRPTYSIKYTRENYYKDKNGFAYVVFEFAKIYAARLMKHF